MSAKVGAPASIRSGMPVALRRVEPAMLFAVGACYLGHAAAVAAATPFWMDEVLAVWTARAPDVWQLWRSLVAGSEFTPPAFDLLLHGFMRLGLDSHLALRSPSILAGLLCALATADFARRHLGGASAVLAFAAVLASGLFTFAVQARPYACSTAAIAWAVALWDRSHDERAPGPGRAAAVGGLAALAIAFHFYAVIPAGLLGLAEVLHGVRHRRLRPAFLAALILAGASLLLWYPIAHAAAVFNGGDVTANNFYGRPGLLGLASSYSELIFPLWPALAVAIVAARVLPHLATGRVDGRDRLASRFGAVAGAALALPAAVCAFALVVTHAYSTRYAIGGALGFALLLASLATSLDDRVALLIAAVLAVLPLAAGDRIQPDHAAVLAAAPPNLPIVTGDGLRFLELSEAADPALARRLVYLRVPEDARDRDPTNRHQVERWAALRPELRIADADALLCRTPHFILYADPRGGHDDAPTWLHAHAAVSPLAAGETVLFQVSSPPCAQQP